MKKITLIILLGLMIGIVAHADVYQVYLYYDHGKLYFDRSYDKKVNVLRGEKISSDYPGGNFKAEVLDSRGNILNSQAFDPRPYTFYDIPRGGGGSVISDTGATGFRLSYYPTGNKINIYDPKNALILEYDISYLASCNNNDICEPQLREDFGSCPADCKKVINSQAAEVVGTSSVSKYYILALLAAAGAIVLWAVLRLIKKRRANAAVKP